MMMVPSKLERGVVQLSQLWQLSGLELSPKYLRMCARRQSLVPAKSMTSWSFCSA